MLALYTTTFLAFISAAMATSSFAGDSNALSSEHVTNVERLARGLTPNPPKRRRANGCRRRRTGATGSRPIKPSEYPPSKGAGESYRPTDSNDSDWNKTPDNKTPDNKTPDNKAPDNKTPDNATPDWNKTSDRNETHFALPGGKIGGHVACVDADGHSYKFAAKVNDRGVFTYTEGEDLAVFNIDLQGATKGPVNIEYEPTYLIGNFIHNGFTYLGGVSPGVSIGPGESTYAHLGSTAMTDPGSTASHVKNSVDDVTDQEDMVESAIWSYDQVHGRLMPQWRNVGGSTVDLHVFYNPEINGFSMTDDIGAFKSSHGDVNECRLAFKPVVDVLGPRTP